MRLAAILNSKSGSLRSIDVDLFARHVQEVFKSAGDEVDVTVARSSEMPEMIERAFADPSIDGVIAAGGDGTISLAAMHAWKTGKLLIPVPAGTMNLFTRGLSIPQEIFNAAESLASGKDMDCDIVTANGRPFIHHFSVGLQPKMIRLRASMQYRSRFGKMLASLKATLFAIRTKKAVRASISCDGADPQRSEFGMITVSNNLYGTGHMPYSDSPYEGKLGVYTVPPLPSRGLIGVSYAVMTGRWSQHPSVSVQECREVVLRFHNSTRRVRASIDGELDFVDDEVLLRIHKKAFRVRVPQQLSKSEESDFELKNALTSK